MTTQLKTKEDIVDGEDITIIAKVESKATFDDGNHLYSLRDLNGNEFELKIWADEVNQYDIKTGQWYRFCRALGDTFDEPMIDSHQGQLVAESFAGIDIADTGLQQPNTTVQDIEDGKPIDIVAQIISVREFDDGDLICKGTDIENRVFNIKFWADEAERYNPEIGQWYMFRSAKGDTYDDPMIDSNMGQLTDIPLQSIDLSAISVTFPNTTKSDIRDDKKISIVGTLTSKHEFDDGNVLYTADDINGDKFAVKIWADEKDQYFLSTGKTYLFYDAMGDTYDDPLIDSSQGEMNPIPIAKDRIS